MALPVFNPSIRPSPGASFTPQVKVYEAEFGDGYSQPTPAGINNVRRTVDLRWDALTMDQMHEIDGFFTARRGAEPFWFQPFGMATSLKWICKEWASSHEGGYFKLSAKLVQDFSNAV